MANQTRLISPQSLFNLLHHPPRWFSAAAEAIPAAAATNSNSHSSMFRKLRNVEVKNDGSSSELKNMIDGWIADGVCIKRHHVVSWIFELRRFHKYTIALQISEWMEKSKKFAMNNSDLAVRIDLIFATKGVTEAEKYFDGLQTSDKTMKTFGSLLSCYYRENMAEKAVELLEKMKESGVTPTTLNMSMMMHLYLKVGQPEKVHLLMKELEDLEITPNKYAYNHLMISYAALKDYDSAEKVLEKMMARKLSPDWFMYSTLAKIHIDAGCFEKAIDDLERIEKMEKLSDPKALRCLITLYSKISNRLGVQRAWDLLKTVQKNVSNDDYLSLLFALAQLGDFDGLDKYFKEWESSCTLYDVRICNVLIESYLNRDMLTEARSLFDVLVSKDVKRTFRTQTLFMDFYLKKGQTDIAMQFLDKGAAKMKEMKYNDRFPTEATVNLFLKSFDENSDTVNAQRFHEIMKGLNRP